jgi:hypothetical protein
VAANLDSVDHLQLTVDYMDGDGTLKLCATVQCEGFRGHSCAWFGVSQLEEFADRLLAYPLPLDDHPTIRGGFWNKKIQGEIEQLHLALSFYPVGLRGAVGCLVTLQTPLHDSEKPKVASEVKTELRTSYQALAEFSQDLKKLVLAEVPEAVLKAIVI